jgi:hypothetical protein
MTNARVAKRMLKPLMAAHPDLVWFPQAVRPPDVAVILAPPIHHVVKTIHIETSRWKHSFDLHHKYGVLASFNDLGPPCSVRNLFANEEFASWSTLAEEFCDQVVRRIEEKILPLFRRVETLRDLVELDRTHPPSTWGPGTGRCDDYTRFVLHAANNELEAAEAIWFEEIPRRRAEFPRFPPSATHLALEVDLLPLVRARPRQRRPPAARLGGGGDRPLGHAPLVAAHAPRGRPGGVRRSGTVSDRARRDFA